MEKQLAAEIVNFSISSILGYESGLYKKLKQNIQNEQCKNFLITVNVKYFNQLYRSLILKDDPYVTESFSKMHNILNHSDICLLNILFVITSTIIRQIDRTVLNTNTYEEYMNQIKEIIKNMDVCNINKIEQSLSHECNGIDISTCNPNEDMFFITHK